jgi:hypothetical protein
LESLEQFQQNSRIIQDFTTTTLAAIRSEFARLLYVSSLRDLSSGRYDHAGLAAIYPPGAVQQAMETCHAELFLRILESSLEEQERDLRLCLSHMKSDSLPETAQRWAGMEVYRVLVPDRVPEYLRDLFFSNLRLLLELLGSEPARDRPGV